MRETRKEEVCGRVSCYFDVSLGKGQTRRDDWPGQEGDIGISQKKTI